MIEEVTIGLAACIAAAFVLRPLREGIHADAALPPPSDAAARKEAALKAVLDLEEDLEAGKISDADYGTLRERYENEAVAALREIDEARAADASLEQRVASARANLCPRCRGPRAVSGTCPRCDD